MTIYKLNILVREEKNYTKRKERIKLNREVMKKKKMLMMGRRNLNTLSTPTGRTVNVRIDAHRLNVIHQCAGALQKNLSCFHAL